MQYNWGMYVLLNIFCIQLINLALKNFVGHRGARPRDKPRDRLHTQGLTTLSNFSSFGQLLYLLFVFKRTCLSGFMDK
jgi:hypothetical protein